MRSGEIVRIKKARHERPSPHKSSDRMLGECDFIVDVNFSGK